MRQQVEETARDAILVEDAALIRHGVVRCRLKVSVDGLRDLVWCLAVRK